MLNEYNEKLNALREKMARSGKLESMLWDLRKQRDELTARVGELARELSVEQADVDRISGGFRSIYYAIIGKKEEMLEKERAEVLKASMKYQTAKEELEGVQQEIDSLEWEVGSIKMSEREYRDVLDRKIEAMKQLGVQAEKIAEMEEKKEYLGVQLREVREAMEAGRRVMGQIEKIGKSLDSAEGWGTWDLFGGGLVADIAKHSHLDDAQQGVKTLEALLRRFRTELTDITIQTDLQVLVDGFLRFADWFFDGLFADWAVLSRIQNSQESLNQTRRQVQRVMEQLYKMDREMERKREWLDGEIRLLAEEA